MVVVLLLMQRPFVEAQGTILGTFRWQLQPYCNVITATVVQLGSIYQVNGTDDQCGAARAASVVGLAFPESRRIDRLRPHDRHDARRRPAAHGRQDLARPSAALWTDSAAQTGTFAFVPAGGTESSPRPGPSTVILPGSVTTAELADGSVTTAKLAAGAVTSTQLANSAVGNAQIATNAVTAAKIAPASITSSKIAAGALTAALQCVNSGVTVEDVNAGFTRNTTAPACPLGYTQTATNCESSTWQMPFALQQRYSLRAEQQPGNGAAARQPHLLPRALTGGRPPSPVGGTRSRLRAGKRWPSAASRAIVLAAEAPHVQRVRNGLRRQQRAEVLVGLPADVLRSPVASTNLLRRALVQVARVVGRAGTPAGSAGRHRCRRSRRGTARGRTRRPAVTHSERRLAQGQRHGVGAKLQPVTPDAGRPIEGRPAASTSEEQVVLLP
ncbi:MAG: hypothetical protein R2708_12690 [Vicinamibacterales bacterium]